MQQRYTPVGDCYSAVMKTRLLLYCGIVAVILYAAANAIVPFFAPGYSVWDHTVSELSATGAPTRTLWVTFAFPYAPLFALFGWGVIRAAPNKWIAASGWLLLAYGIFNLYWPPMHTREILASGGATLSDTLHLVWAGISVAMFIGIMTTAAIGMQWRFRIYTFASIIVLAFFGLLTSLSAPDVAKNLPTPWAGLYERINMAVFLIWIATFAVLLIRRTRAHAS